MNIFKRYAKHLEQFTVERQTADLFAILKRHEDTVVDLNISQLAAGINPDGSAIEPEYTERTIAIKKAKNQPYDRVTLHDEGDFWQEMYMDGTGFPASITSANWKTAFLIEKYGDFFGLSDKSVDILQEGYTNEDVRAYYREQVFKLPNN